MEAAEKALEVVDPPREASCLPGLGWGWGRALSGARIGSVQLLTGSFEGTGGAGLAFRGVGR